MLVAYHLGISLCFTDPLHKSHHFLLHCEVQREMFPNQLLNALEQLHIISGRRGTHEGNEPAEWELPSVFLVSHCDAPQRGGGVWTSHTIIPRLIFKQCPMDAMLWNITSPLMSFKTSSEPTHQARDPCDSSVHVSPVTLPSPSLFPSLFRAKHAELVPEKVQNWMWYAYVSDSIYISWKLPYR